MEEIIRRDHQKRSSEETCKANLQKRLTKETYKKEKPTKETYKAD